MKSKRVLFMVIMAGAAAPLHALKLNRVILATDEN